MRSKTILNSFLISCLLGSLIVVNVMNQHSSDIKLTQIKGLSVSNENKLNIEWSIINNTNTNDLGKGVVNDSLDNIYITGTLNDSFQIFIAKYNSLGQLAWFKTWRNFFRQSGDDITIDSSGNIYVVGSVWGSPPSGYFQDTLLIKFDNAGNLLWNITWHWSEDWGGDWYSEGYSVKTDMLDNIYISGKIQNESGAEESEYRAFLSKFNNLGIEQWNWTYGHQEIHSWGRDISIDSLGNVYFLCSIHKCGSCDLQNSLIKFNNNGIYQWNTTIKQTNTNIEVFQEYIDKSNNIFVLGEIPTALGDLDVIVMKYNNLGIQLWNISWGGSSNEITRGGIITNSDGDIFAVGSTRSYDLGEFNFFLLSLNSSGGINWYETWGGSDTDYGYDVAIDSLQNVYVVGTNKNNTYNLAILKYSYDSIIPLITINSPLPNAVYGTNAPNYDIEIIEDNLNLMWYTINGGLINVSFSDLIGTIDQPFWDSAPEGNINLVFYAQDTSGNIGTVGVIITKNIPSEITEILGYNVFVFIGALFVVVILIIKRAMRTKPLMSE